MLTDHYVNFTKIEISKDNLLLFDMQSQLGMRFTIIEGQDALDNSKSNDGLHLLVEPIGLYLDGNHLDGFSLQETISLRPDIRLFLSKVKVGETLLEMGMHHTSFFSLLCTHPQLAVFLNNQGLLLVIVDSLKILSEDDLLLSRKELLAKCYPKYPPRFMALLKRIRSNNWSLKNACALIRTVYILLKHKPDLIEKLLKLEFVSLARLQLIVNLYQAELPLIELIFQKDMEPFFSSGYDNDKLNSFITLLKDIRRMDKLTDIRGDYQNVVKFKKLEEYHQRQNSDYKIKREILSLGVSEENKTPIPCLKGTPEIRHVATFGELYQLASDMTNCLASYAEQVLTKDLDVYRVTIDGTDYTLTLNRLPKQKGISLHGLLGRCNIDPPLKVKKIVDDWINGSYDKQLNLKRLNLKQ
ncbi:MAG: hypothetical protein COA86_02310 [Kangiella sp.]|nr:MAG: hypothetical protein COA86_02310 [Kangiella sp.]